MEISNHPSWFFRGLHVGGLRIHFEVFNLLKESVIYVRPVAGGWAFVLSVNYPC